MAKVLIAEDDESTLDIFATAIEALGHCVIKTNNGKLAWDVLSANRDVGLLICDIAMPEMDGRELVKRVRGDGRFSSLPILIVSGAIRAKEISVLLEQGVTCFMAKPVNLQELTQTVQHHLH